MDTPEQTIFRRQAVQRYRQGQQGADGPRLVMPARFARLWLLLLLLCAAGLALAWATPVPVRAAGSGLLLRSGAGADGRQLAGFFPPELLPRLRVGQPVELRVGGQGAAARGRITRVEPAPVDPVAAQQRYGAPNGAVVPITGPAAVVVVRLEAPPPAAAGTAGATFQIAATIGSQRLMAVLAAPAQEGAPR